MSDKTMEYNRGWYFPVSVLRLYQSGDLNAEQMMLLGIINSLQHPQHGCFATNQYLANAWGQGKSAVHVSRNIADFKELGLVKVTYNDKEQRVLRVTWQPDTLNQKDKGGASKRLRTPHPKGYTEEELNEREHSAKADREFSSASFGIKEKNKYHEAVARFAEHAVKQRHHVGMRGTTGKGWEQATIKKWVAECREFIHTTLGGDWEIFEFTLNWYIYHFDDEYVPECRTFLTFLEKFNRIQAAIARKKAMARHRNGEDHDEDRERTAVGYTTNGEEIKSIYGNE